MENEEADIALEELDQRLDRLRALYEQYFLGIEKVEPSVARKDVDRRIWILRRAQLRNTARRFRLQNLIQRYNTFQQYWIRICRQIEDGTYSRHVRKAELRFGKPALTIAAQRRDLAHSKMLTMVAEKAARGSPSQLATGQGASMDAEVDQAFDRLAGPGASLPPSVRPMATPSGSAGRHSFAPSSAPAPAGPSSASLPPLSRPMSSRLPAIPAKSLAPTSAGQNAALTLPAFPAAAKSPAAPAAMAGSNPLRGAAQLSSGSAPKARPAAPESGGGLSDQRVRELHAQLLAEKRKLADGSSVSLDNLSKNLQETAAKLRGLHGQNKAVDFRVVVKGGKAIVKPVIR